jgi:bzd-type benzoyl-CoA reductase N subunit
MTDTTIISPNNLPEIEYFHSINRAFPGNSEIMDFKAQGKKVFGWLCTYVPEELIVAAGALPVRITGYGRETDLDDGNAYLYINNCSFSRSCFQRGLRGDYSFLDGVVGGSTCDGARRLFDVWRRYINTPFYQVLTVPRKTTDDAQALYLSQVISFKQNLEEFLGFEITEQNLLNAVELCNETRGLLKKLYELRKRLETPITGAQTLEILTASFRMPKASFNAKLKHLLVALENSPVTYKGRARLMLVGSVMDNPEFLQSIEETGGLVVTDELCTSTRYWSDPVIINNGEPVINAIAHRYLSNFPCARMYPSEERFDRIMALCRDFKVDGVISQIIRYCVPYAHDVPLLNDKMKAAKIPLLNLDVEYGSSGSGQIRTRVQAFLEMMEAHKK